MHPAAEKLSAALSAIQISAPQIPVLHNADVTSYQHADQIRDVLARQLYSPVRWVETVRAMANDGVTLAAECGPGKVLTGLTKRIDDRVAATALISVDALTEFNSLIA